MNNFTNSEMLGLGRYITNELMNMIHIEIQHINIDNSMAIIKFKINPGIYEIVLWKQDAFYIEYKIYSTYRMNKSTTQLYEIEDFNDVFNVLEDIFDTIRPRDEY